MRKNSRYLSILLAIIMVFTILPFSSLEVNAVNAPTVSLNADSTTAAVGDIITLTVETSPNSKIVSFGSKITYDKDYFEVVTNSVSFSSNLMGEANIGTIGQVRIAFASGSPLADSVTELVSVKFKVLKVNGTIDMNVIETYIVDGNTDKNVTTDVDAAVQPLKIICKHSYSSSITTEPECTVDGIKTFVCSVCNDNYTEPVVATGHTVVTINAKAPNCTEAGYEAYEYCSVCDYTTFNETPATGHTIVTVNAKAPNCTETGYDAYEYCSVCDYTTFKETPSTGHSIVNIEAKAPTCTEIGYNAYEYCSVCDYTTYEEIPATGHTIVNVNAKLPTCTEIGNEAYEYCSVCDYTTYKEIPATGHSYDAVVTAPTCTDQGFTTYTCSCGDTYVADVTPEKGHTVDDAVVENTSDATCGTPGTYDEVVYCAVCGYEISRETKTTDTLPHAYTSKVTTVPTCTETGVKTFTCSVCGDSYTEPVLATGHTIVNVDAKAPTCTEIGWNVYEYCSVCDYSTYEEIPATGHSTIPVDAKVPSCTEIGWDSYEYCSVCDYSTYEEISSTGHSYDAVVTAPTCTEQGYTTYSCHCDDSYVDNYVDALGHDFKDGSCTRCGATDPDYFTFEIQTPSTTEIRFKDGIILHAKIEGNLPKGAEIKWTADNKNFDLTDSTDGKSFTIVSRNKGYTTITATVYDADENEIAQDTVKMYSNAGFLQKLIGFFRVIFRSTEILDK